LQRQKDGKKGEKESPRSTVSNRCGFGKGDKRGRGSDPVEEGNSEGR